MLSWRGEVISAWVYCSADGRLTESCLPLAARSFLLLQPRTEEESLQGVHPAHLPHLHLGQPSLLELLHVLQGDVVHHAALDGLGAGGGGPGEPAVWEHLALSTTGVGGRLGAGERDGAPGVSLRGLGILLAVPGDGGGRRGEEGLAGQLLLNCGPVDVADQVGLLSLLSLPATVSQTGPLQTLQSYLVLKWSQFPPENLEEFHICGEARWGEAELSSVTLHCSLLRLGLSSPSVKPVTFTLTLHSPPVTTIHHHHHLIIALSPTPAHSHHLTISQSVLAS